MKVIVICDVSFSGHHLIASKPVLVQVGYENIVSKGAKPGPTKRLHFEETVLPVEQWSQDYVCVGVPGSLRVLSSSPNVTVTVVDCSLNQTKSNTFLLKTVGSFIEVKMNADCPVRIKSSEPVHILQHFQGQNLQHEFMFNVVAIEKFLPLYTVWIPVEQLYIVIQVPHLDGLYFLGENV
ncbi:IgG Fc-binding protein [Plakobranchus ocellatus]|uniref:IgG Fc-binding protein n=1 Tax=Plakobranchus ocellatus TaxID=259542 RepID=A0AAV4D7W4_9GAST|nr:IgG Fc-binding protein [Plakobranchus ocellatus]